MSPTMTMEVSLRWRANASTQVRPRFSFTPGPITTTSGSRPTTSDATASGDAVVQSSSHARVVVEPSASRRSSNDPNGRQEDDHRTEDGLGGVVDGFPGLDVRAVLGGVLGLLGHVERAVFEGEHEALGFGRGHGQRDQQVARTAASRGVRCGDGLVARIRRRRDLLDLHLGDRAPCASRRGWSRVGGPRVRRPARRGSSTGMPSMSTELPSPAHRVRTRRRWPPCHRVR